MLGIDPGLARTGVGAIAKHDGVCRYIHHEVLRTSSDSPLAARLAHINREVLRICEQLAPDEAVIERTFVNVNPSSSLNLGHARGAALTALGLNDIPVNEVAPTSVKRHVAGDGGATKTQVANMVRQLLDLDKSLSLPADASDALAIALCHALEPAQKLRRRTLRTRSRRRRR